jgi:hypothetical protein
MADGTVKSVAVTGGVTGLITRGGPVVVAGTISLDGVLKVGYGGTGHTTANASFNALAPSQTDHAGHFLTTDGISTAWIPMPYINIDGGNPTSKYGGTFGINGGKP